MITTILTILNTIALIYLLVKHIKLYVTFNKKETYENKTLLGYEITLWRKTSEYSASSILTLRIPLKNAKKVELEEEVQRLISGTSSHNRLQTLSAKFSWLKTIEQVRQFEKDYSVVDRKIVENLVSNYIKKQGHV